MQTKGGKTHNQTPTGKLKSRIVALKAGTNICRHQLNKASVMVSKTQFPVDKETEQVSQAFKKLEAGDR